MNRSRAQPLPGFPGARAPAWRGLALLCAGGLVAGCAALGAPRQLPWGPHDLARELLAPLVLLVLTYAFGVLRLRRERARFTALAEAVPQLVWIQEPSGALRSLNHRWQPPAAAGAPGPGGAPYAPHPDDASAAWDAWRRSQSRGGAFEHTLRLLCPDGGYRWFRVRAVPHRDGARTQWFGTATDMDEAMRAELEKRSALERAELLQALTASLSAALTPADVARAIFDKGLLLVGARAAALYLVRGEERDLVGAHNCSPDAQGLLPDGAAWVELLLHVQGGCVGILKVELPAPNVAPREKEPLPRALLSLWAQALDRARLLEHERSARQESERRAQKAADGERWFEAMLNLVPSPVVFVEPGSGEVTFANAAADMLAGGSFPRGEMARNLSTQYPYLDQAGRRILEEHTPLQRAARGERFSGLQVDWVAPDGKRALLVSSKRFPAMYGKPPVAVLTFEDVSELKAAQSELQQAVRLRDDFLSVAAHELKTPLTSLALQIKLLMRELNGIAEPRVNTLERQAARLTTLVHGLLDVSRISAGRLSLEPRHVDVAALLKEVVSRLEPEAVKSGTTLGLTARRPVHGTLDPIRFEQVATNLLSNALKYGAGAPVEVTLEERDGMGVLSVRDYGIGIPPDSLERIFQKFERAVSSANYGGLGLGLYIVRQIVEASGGTIRAESSLGRGATFIVEIPLRREVELEPLSAAARLAPRALSAASPPPHAG